MTRACLLLSALVLCAGCNRRLAPESTSPTTVATNPTAPQADSLAADRPVQNPSLVLEPIDDRPGLHNVLRVTNQILSGGQPVGDDAFAHLATLGVTVIVSVDGARPDVETARRHGLRTVHIPIGYDGIPPRAALALARVMHEATGAVYVHCHHGKHRAPAAAAIASIASGALDPDAADAILERAGTSRDYAHLWRDVRNYVPPEPGTPLPELVEIAEVKSLAAAMARMDRSLDLLELSRDQQWSTPLGHPDVVPDQEALQLKEGLHEAARNLADSYDQAFRDRLTATETLAHALELALKTGDRAAAIQLMKGIEVACAQCHASYRD